MTIQSSRRQIAARILIGIITFVFTMSAISKIADTQALGEMFEKFGLRDNMKLIGVGELVSAWLYLIPQTSSFGLLLMSAYLGGAIATHLQHGEIFVVPAVLLVLVWLAGYLRHPEVFQSFRSTRRSIKNRPLSYDDHQHGLSR